MCPIQLAVYIPNQVVLSVRHLQFHSDELLFMSSDAVSGNYFPIFLTVFCFHFHFYYFNNPHFVMCPYSIATILNYKITPPPPTWKRKREWISDFANHLNWTLLKVYWVRVTEYWYYCCLSSTVCLAVLPGLVYLSSESSKGTRGSVSGNHCRC